MQTTRNGENRNLLPSIPLNVANVQEEGIDRIESVSVEVFSAPSPGFLRAMPAYRGKWIFSQLQEPRDEVALPYNLGRKPAGWYDPEHVLDNIQGASLVAHQFARFLGDECLRVAVEELGDDVDPP